MKKEHILRMKDQVCNKRDIIDIPGVPNSNDETILFSRDKFSSKNQITFTLEKPIGRNVSIDNSILSPSKLKTY